MQVAAYAAYDMHIVAVLIHFMSKWLSCTFGPLSNYSNVHFWSKFGVRLDQKCICRWEHDLLQLLYWQKSYPRVLTLGMDMSCSMNTAQVFKFERHIKTVQFIKVTFRAPLIFDSDVAINQVISKWYLSYNISYVISDIYYCCLSKS